jgi:hypothetical protein
MLSCGHWCQAGGWYRFFPTRPPSGLAQAGKSLYSQPSILFPSFQDNLYKSVVSFSYLIEISPPLKKVGTGEKTSGWKDFLGFEIHSSNPIAILFFF